LGDEELTGLVAQSGTTLGIDVEIAAGLQGGGSDHMSFAHAGIPVVMFFGQDFSLIHTPGDTLEAVTPHLLGDAADVALALLESPEFRTILN
jgi:Zn-dependent M28 family amino/carboxypeptidase